MKVKKLSKRAKGLKTVNKITDKVAERLVFLSQNGIWNFAYILETAKTKSEWKRWK